jgi:2'-5' RNA ligase
MVEGDVLFLIRVRQDLVSTVMNALAIKGRDKELGRGMFPSENWHQSISDALPGDPPSRARLRAVGARVSAPAFHFVLDRICSRGNSGDPVQWSLRGPENKPKGLTALADMLRVGIESEGFGPQGGHTAHVTLSYDAPARLADALRIPPVAWSIDAFELVACRHRPYRYETIERWPLLRPGEPVHGQPDLFGV